MSEYNRGRAAELYAFDKGGNYSQALSLIDATNENWEDLAQDEAGNLCVGDFGNKDDDILDLKT